jgi:hypothetical protein
LIKSAQAGTGNNPVDSSAALTAEVQLFAVNVIGYQIGWWNRQIAMDTGVGHRLRG